MNTETLRKISTFAFPGLILIGILAFVVFEVWQPHAENEKVEEQTFFQHKHHRDTDNLQTTIDLYVQALYSARGFVVASDNVSREEWGEYFNGIGIGKQLPGLGLLAYIQQVTKFDQKSFLNELNTDTDLIENHGLSNISIHPVTESDVFQVAKYIEPEDTSTMKSLIGFDFSSEQTRRDAFEKARDTNQPTTTAPVHFYSNQKAGFVIMLPLYKKNMSVVTPDERRAAYYGLVVISVRIKDIFDNSFQQLAAENTLVQVYDGLNTNSDNLMYQNMDPIQAPESDLMSVIEPVQLADRTITVKYTSMAPVAAYTLIPSVWGRLGILVLTNLLTAWFIWTRVRTSKP